jgi:signal transduction histidine kinase
LIADRLRENKVDPWLAAGRPACDDRSAATKTASAKFCANLLSNAANFAPASRRSAWHRPSVEGGTEFSVHDDGPGMPPEVGHGLPSVRRPANGGRRRGAGLGLAIVKSFVELHGGSVRIETGSGRGTTVTCFFPAEPTAGGLHDAAE